MLKDKNNFFDEQWVQVFSAGTQTDSGGYTKTWTEDDLKKIVKMYNGQTEHEAPLVIGHPQSNHPAYGWVEKLKTDGKLLYAKFNQVSDGMKEAVKTGMFKKRSIALYPNLLLRHIGFLGAVPPAVKGLADIKFQSSEDKFMEFSYGLPELEGEKEEPEIPWEVKSKLRTIGNIFGTLREKLIESYGIEKADEFIRKWEVEDLQKEFAECMAILDGKEGEKEMSKELLDKIEVLETKFNEQLKESNDKLEKVTKQFEEVSKKNEELEKTLKEKSEFAEKGEDSQVKDTNPEMLKFQEQTQNRIKELESKLQVAEQKSRTSEFKEFVASLHSEGKIPTELQKDAVDLMEVLHNNQKMNFSDGEHGVLDKFKSFLTAQPKIVQFGESGNHKNDKKDTNTAMDQLDKIATEFCEKDANLSYFEAFVKAQEQNPELAQKARSEI